MFMYFILEYVDIFPVTNNILHVFLYTIARKLEFNESKLRLKIYFRI